MTRWRDGDKGSDKGVGVRGTVRLTTECQGDGSLERQEDGSLDTGKQLVDHAKAFWSIKGVKGTVLLTHSIGIYILDQLIILKLLE